MEQRQKKKNREKATRRTLLPKKTIRKVPFPLYKERNTISLQRKYHTFQLLEENGFLWIRMNIKPHFCSYLYKR